MATINVKEWPLDSNFLLTLRYCFRSFIFYLSLCVLSSFGWLIDDFDLATEVNCNVNNQRRLVGF